MNNNITVINNEDSFYAAWKAVEQICIAAQVDPTQTERGRYAVRWGKWASDWRKLLLIEPGGSRSQDESPWGRWLGEVRTVAPRPWDVVGDNYYTLKNGYLGVWRAPHQLPPEQRRFPSASAVIAFVFKNDEGITLVVDPASWFLTARGGCEAEIVEYASGNC